MRALNYFVNEAAESLLRSWRSAALAILTIAAGLFVLGFFLMVNNNLQRVVGRWSEAAEMSVYLKDDVDARASCRRSSGVIDAERPGRTSAGTCRRRTQWRGSGRIFPTWPARPSGSSAIRCRLRSRCAWGRTRARRGDGSRRARRATGIGSQAWPTCATTGGG